MIRNMYVLVILTLFISTSVFAGEVTKIKGSNALLDLKGDSAAPGDMFFSIGADGKRHGIIQITKVKGDKAIGKITKGKVDVGMTLEHRAGGGGATAKRSNKGSKSSAPSASGRSYWGGMVGYSRNDGRKTQIATITRKAGKMRRARRQ